MKGAREITTSIETIWLTINDKICSFLKSTIFIIFNFGKYLEQIL